MAVDLARSGGRILLAGLKHFAEVPGFVTDHIVLKSLQLYGGAGFTPRVDGDAVALIESGAVRTDVVAGEVFDLDDIDDAMALLARRDPDPRRGARRAPPLARSGIVSFFGLRFDFRNPDFAGTTMAERYAAALDMAEWADRLGFVIIVLSEHHGSDDGYLPEPTRDGRGDRGAHASRRAIRIAALIAPFHDPLRLAEDIAVVDLLSNGRLDLVDRQRLRARRVRDVRRARCPTGCGARPRPSPR